MKPSRHIFLFLFFAVIFSSCGISLAADVTPPPGYVPAPTPLPAIPPAPPSPERGAALYTEKCAACHGDSGQGDGPDAAQLAGQGVTVAALASAEVANPATPQRWYNMVTNGNIQRFMPPFKSLTDQERWDVVAYALTLSAPADTVSTGAALFTQHCARCHGETGLGDGEEAGALSIAPANLTDQERMAGLSAATIFDTLTVGKDPMPAFANLLSEDERWLLSAYVRTLSFAQPAEVAAPEPLPAAATPAPGMAVTPQVTETATATLTSTFPTSITVTGEVIHGTGGEIPSSLDILLYIFDHVEGNIQLTDTLTGTMLADHSYQFDGVLAKEGLIYAASLEYQQTTFGSDIAVLETPSLTLTLPITIYETTTDVTALSIDRLHIVLDFSAAGMVQVEEIYAISNPGESVLVAAQPDGGVTPFGLPDGASAPSFMDGEMGVRYLPTADGFADTQSVYPGMAYQMQFFYTLPFANSLAFSHAVYAPAQAAVILLPEGSATLEGNQYLDEGTFTVQGNNYHIYSFTGALPAGGKVEFTLKGGSSSGGGLAALSTDRTGLVIGLGVFGGALVLAGVWMYLRSRQPAVAAVEEELEEDALEPPAADEDAETLMDAINALDDLYRDGKLPEAGYRERRAELKEKLKRAMG